jgi:hypothetical protein
MGSNKINIGNVGGNINGNIIAGSGNVTGENINISGTITINEKDLEKVPAEYAQSLKQFESTINEELKKNKIEKEKIEPVQESLNELAKEMKEIPPAEELPPHKKNKIGAKLANIAEGLLKILPKTAETIAAFTPLAPFSKLIGEGVEAMVTAIQKEV